MPGVTYEVFEKLGILSESPTGWTKELRLVSWNGRSPRYDLREWSPGDRTVSRGIALSLKELRALLELLLEMEFPESPEADEQGEDCMLMESVDLKQYKREGGSKKKAG